jgi:hypothetical protein
MFNDTPPVFVVLGVNLISPMNQGYSKIIIYLCDNIYVLLAYYQCHTMIKDILSGKRYLLALALTDGALDDYPEERRREMIISITEIYERMLDEPPPTDSDCKNSPKVSK